MQLTEQFKFFNQAKIISGNKGLNNIPVELDDYNATKPLVITDKKSVEKKFDKIFIKALSDSNLIIGALYDSVSNEAKIAEVRKLVDLYIGRGCDSIIAIGSESSMNTAKAVNLMLCEKKDFLEITKVNHNLKPLIGILTIDSRDTFTTDIVTVDARTLQSNNLFPNVVIIDPRMVKGGSEESVVERSLLALTQSIEAGIYGVNNPMNDSYIYSASQYIYENIKTLSKDRQETEAAVAIANAVYMAGVAFSNAPTGIAYATAKEIHKLTGESIGKVAAIILPHALRWINGKKDNGIKDKILQSLIGIEGYAKTPSDKRAIRVIDEIENLIVSFPKLLPSNLKDLKLQRYILENIANIIPDKIEYKITAKECLSIIEAAWSSEKEKV